MAQGINGYCNDLVAAVIDADVKGCSWRVIAAMAAVMVAAASIDVVVVAAVSIDAVICCYGYCCYGLCLLDAVF